MKNFRFMPLAIACIFALAVFAFYQYFYGDKNNQAYASLSHEEAQSRLINYKPARKRALRAKLRKDVDHLLELKGHDVIQIFDAPELIRRDLPTTVWQYRNDKCVMDVYFTVGAAGNIGRENVSHYEMRARDTRSERSFDPTDCVKGLVVSKTAMSMIDVNAIYKASGE